MIEFNFLMLNIMLLVCTVPLRFVGLADQGKDIVCQIHYRVQQHKGLWHLDNSSTFKSGFLKDGILACVET